MAWLTVLFCRAARVPPATSVPSDALYLHSAGSVGRFRPNGGSMRKVITALAATAALGLAAVAVAGTAQASDRRPLPGSVPTWAKATALRSHAAATDHVGFRVYLGWRDGAAAQQLAAAVSTPGS